MKRSERNRAETMEAVREILRRAEEQEVDKLFYGSEVYALCMLHPEDKGTAVIDALLYGYMIGQGETV